MKHCIVCLQDLDLFQGLKPEQFAHLCQSANRRKLQRGDYLFCQGDITNTIYLIKSGKLKLVQTDRNGHETILEVVGPGEVLGELSLYQEQPEHSSAVAMEEACICCFSKLQFEAAIKQNPTLALRIIDYLGQKRYEAMLNTGRDSGLPVKERLLRLIYNLAEEYGRETDTATLIDLKITQQELADMIGASRVMVSQAIRELEAANVIARKARYFILKSDPCTSSHTFL